MTHHHWYGQDQDWCHVCWNASLGMQASWIRLDGFIPANRFVLRLERGGSNLLIGSAIPQASKQACNEARTEKGQEKPTQPRPAYFVSSFLVSCCVCLLSVEHANLSDNHTQKDFPPEPFWSFLMSHFATRFFIEYLLWTSLRIRSFCSLRPFSTNTTWTASKIHGIFQFCPTSNPNDEASPADIVRVPRSVAQNCTENVAMLCAR